MTPAPSPPSSSPTAGSQRTAATALPSAEFGPGAGREHREQAQRRAQVRGRSPQAPRDARGAEPDLLALGGDARVEDAKLVAEPDA